MDVIVIGGGLAGLSAAHTALQAGLSVLLIERNAFCGGNSTKATSGLNGAGTRTQKKLGIADTKEIFEEDTIRGATGVKTGPCPPPYPLGRVLSWSSAEAVHWVQDSFGLALDAVSRLGGHSMPRTHRTLTGGKFPGMEITYALMQKFEEVSESTPSKARLLTKSRANRLITDASGAVVGVGYENGGKQLEERAKAVVIATGGYGAGGLFPNSILKRVRPDLQHLPTTNGMHCTGDGVEMAEAIGAASIDLKHIQVHPTGLVNPSDPNNRVLFLAAEALRGEGGILLDRNGKRFCNDLGTRDYVTGMMWKNEGPFRLLLNSKSSSKIAWHCKHYTGRGVMKAYKTGQDLAKDMNVSPAVLQQTFTDYNRFAKDGTDPWGKKYFDGVPLDINDSFHVAIVTPVVHYSMGGVKINGETRVLRASDNKPIPGLYSVGEAAGGVHGKNRLGGSALCECIVLGRVAGKHIVKTLNPSAANVELVSTAGCVDLGDSGDVTNAAPASVSGGPPSAASAVSAAAAAPAAAAAAAPSGKKTYTMEEVAKHTTEQDCWVVVNGQVLDVTSFLDDHPGGKMAIMTFAGKDASEEFNMLHEKNVVQKYAKECILGDLVTTKSKL